MKTIGLPTICLLIMGYLGFHLVSGEYGLIAWADMRTELAEREARLTALLDEEEAMRRAVKGLRASPGDTDLLDERAREVLGLARENEYIIRVDPNDRLDAPQRN